MHTVLFCIMDSFTSGTSGCFDAETFALLLKLNFEFRTFTLLHWGVFTDMFLVSFVFFSADIPEPVDPQICQAMCAIMKLSFEEEYRRAMNELGS